MMRVSPGFAVFLSIIGLVAVMGCSDDDCTECPGPIAPPYQNLSQRSHVLNNVQLAYNNRSLNKYDDLLDDNFTFFYTEDDGGGGVPVQWGRLDEMTANQGLFAAANKIELDIKFEDGLSWIEIVPSSAPDEKWYTTTVFYYFKINIGDTTYFPDVASKATFTVRNAGTSDSPHWQLVEMRDLGGPSLRVRSSSITQTKTWGQVKSMYRS